MLRTGEPLFTAPCLARRTFGGAAAVVVVAVFAHAKPLSFSRGRGRVLVSHVQIFIFGKRQTYPAKVHARHAPTHSHTYTHKMKPKRKTIDEIIKSEQLFFFSIKEMPFTTANCHPYSHTPDHTWHRSCIALGVSVFGGRQP